MNNFLQNSSSTGAWRLAVPSHSEYDRLCELAVTGELSTEDRNLLLEHLEYCETCREALTDNKEFAAALSAAFAMADEDAEFDPTAASFDVEAGKERLLKSLERKPSPRGPRLVSIALVSMFGALACFGMGMAWHERHERRMVLNTTRPSARPIQAAKVEVPATSTVVPAAVPASPELPLLRQRLLSATEQKNNLEEQVASLSQRLESAQQEKNALSERTTSLAQQLASAQTEIGSLQDRVALAAKTVQSRQADRELEIGALRASLNAKEAVIAQDEELLAHDRDIRDLMGARNLIIEDIYDVGENGEKKKPVGRIFYTKDKRLLFYGYDLEKQRGLRKDAVFQAWGNNAAGNNVSLGLFYRDDANKRWVLKFSDAMTLARLTNVFVTVEPAGGSEKPTGKRLLAASLRIDPNYP